MNNRTLADYDRFYIIITIIIIMMAVTALTVC